MDEAQVKKIASDVFDQKLNDTQYGFNSIPFHIHNGTDSPKIPFSSLQASNRANGSITMATDGNVYTVGLNFQGTRVDFNGTAVHKTTGVIDKRALVNGVAFLGPSYIIGPLSSTAITVSGKQQALVQGSSSLTVYDDSGTLVVKAITSQTSIVFVVDNPGATQVARAIIINFSSSNFKILVQLAAGWEITGTFAVS